MHQGWLLIGLSLSYLGLLFLIAYVADKNKRRRLQGQPLLYSLSLAVYCTSWTFFGTVGQASESPWSPVPIYLGPMLVFLFGWRLLARLILVAKREHITSIADFIAARYGKSQRLAMVIALIAIMGILPYLVLQLKAIVTGLDLLMANPVPAGPTGNTAGLALGVALLLALFSILFGTRHLDATEHHRGMVVAIAFESVVKLLAFMAVGSFALWLILSKPSQARTLVASDFLDAVVAVTPGSLLELAIYTLVAMCAVICLPRQFHVTVVENNQGQDLHWARWLFPLYLFMMGLFIWPLALAGKQWVGAGMASDTYVISLPMSLGFDGMALLAFLGGTSAATGMVIVCTIALAIMVSNDLVLPVLLRRFWQQGRDERLVRLLLQVRRGAILLILLAAWGLYLWLGDLTSLSRIGYLSFGAVAQFAPALLLGLYWRHGNRKGVYLGLALGVSLWFATLLAESGLLAGSPLAILLAPPDWPAVRDLSLGAWCIFLSLLLNLVGYVAGSLLSRPAVSERLQAANFVGKPSRDTTALYQARVSVKELEMLAARFVGSSRVKRAFGRFAGERGGTLAPQMQASAELIAHTERLLAGVFGTSSARLVLASALQGRNMQLEEIATIVDEASDVFRFNRGLLQGAIEHMGQGISVVDRELKLVAWNRRYIELFHYPPGLIQVGRPIEEIIRYNAQQGLCGPGDVEAQVARRVAFMQRGSQHISARERSDGRVIEMQGNPMPAGGFVMTFTDITPFRDAERVLREANEHLEARVAERTHELSELNRQLLLVNQQVERANHSKSRFLAAVSHDLTQPLNAAKLFTSSLLEAGPHRPPHRRCAGGDRGSHHRSARHLASRGGQVQGQEAGFCPARRVRQPQGGVRGAGPGGGDPVLSGGEQPRGLQRRAPAAAGAAKLPHQRLSLQPGRPGAARLSPARRQGAHRGVGQRPRHSGRQAGGDLRRVLPPRSLPHRAGAGAGARPCHRPRHRPGARPQPDPAQLAGGGLGVCRHPQPGDPSCRNDAGGGPRPARQPTGGDPGALHRQRERYPDRHAVTAGALGLRGGVRPEPGPGGGSHRRRLPAAAGALRLPSGRRQDRIAGAAHAAPRPRQPYRRHHHQRGSQERAAGADPGTRLRLHQQTGQTAQVAGADEQHLAAGQT